MPFLNNKMSKLVKLEQMQFTVLLYWTIIYLSLTHLSQRNIPISIRRTSLFQILGAFGGIIHSYSNFNRTICEQTVVTLTRSYILQLLICVCLVCLCPTKKDARLSRLICNFVVVNHEHDEDRISHVKVNVWTKAFTENGSQL